MPLPAHIAIDGPVASGKSVVGQRLADSLYYLFFDTGVMYRAITFVALRDLKSVMDADAVAALTERTALDVQPPLQHNGRSSTVLADGADITHELRSADVEANVSPVSAMPAVRRILTQHMRRVGLRGKVVMVGRDVGTVILPEADLKVYLTASVEARAQRRFAETQARGEARSYEDILANLRERDRIDSSRASAPLRPAEDAVVLDTTALDVDGVLAAVERLIAERAA